MFRIVAGDTRRFLNKGMDRSPQETSGRRELYQEQRGKPPFFPEGDVTVGPEISQGVGDEPSPIELHGAGHMGSMAQHKVSASIYNGTGKAKHITSILTQKVLRSIAYMQSVLTFLPSVEDHNDKVIPFCQFPHHRSSFPKMGEMKRGWGKAKGYNGNGYALEDEFEGGATQKGVDTLLFQKLYGKKIPFFPIIVGMVVVQRKHLETCLF